MLTLDQGRAMAGLMADKLFEAMRGGAPQAQGVSLLPHRSPHPRGPVAQIQFSGGVSEFIYGNEAKKFGDLGPLLAAEIRARVERSARGWSPRSKASAPPWSAPRNTPSSSAAARSMSRRSTPCRSATCR